ncbi:Poly(U)-binding-splicing factor puf60 [Mortierella alpina]|nr:Poly(U)-binding-splicing factor puf60 [Mortierella alpina]
MQDSSNNNDTVSDRKRSIGGTEEEDPASTTVDDVTKDVNSAVKKARLDQQEGANDINHNSVDGSITEEDSANKGKCLSPHNFMLLASAGTISSASEPEPSLAIANVMEQRKSLCRVYVGSISFEATEDDVRQKLSRFGAIKELVLKVDPATGKHRGFCFVEYDLPEAAILAVQASESVDVGGRHLKIGRPKNYDADAIKDLPPPPEDRIYVANIGSLVSEPDLAGIFAAFGEVEKCVLLFKSGTDINTIVDSMKGFMLLDMPMGVCKAIVGGVLPEGMKSLDSLPLSNAQLQMPTQARVPQAAPTTVVNPAMIARATATAASTAQRLVAMGQSSGASGMNGDRESVASEENMSISGNQRYMVMQSLARSSGLVPPAAPAIPAPMSHVVQPTVVRLQYSATPADIDDQLEEEFKEECSKYGPVIQVQMLPLAEGLLRIFIQFASPVDARSAAAQLNGRQFDGKTIQASLFDQQEYIAGRLV